MAGGSAPGAAGGSPQSTPRQPSAAQSLGAELPAITDAAAAGEVGAGGGQIEEDYQYVPTKVRTGAGLAYACYVAPVLPKLVM